MNRFDTHEVFNQAPPFGDVNLFAATRRCGKRWRAKARGWADATAGRARRASWAAPTCWNWRRLANEFPPRLVNFDRSGRRIDELEFHPAWHALMAPADRERRAQRCRGKRRGAGAQVARAAAYLLFGQVENGVAVPGHDDLRLGAGAAPAARPSPARWLPKILSREYDPRSLPVGAEARRPDRHGHDGKAGRHRRARQYDARHAGSPADAPARASATRARAPGASSATNGSSRRRRRTPTWCWRRPTTTGSAGLSCFFVPRFLPDGSRNAIRVQRLKDKLGNRSNASSRSRVRRTRVGWLVGARGRGIPTILEMGSHTRLDCVLGSAGIMRAALCHALHHARGAQRVRPPAGRAAADAERAGRPGAGIGSGDRVRAAPGALLRPSGGRSAARRCWRRMLTPAGKYWMCKRGPAFGAEAMEVMGGNGYVEDGPLARLYREFAGQFDLGRLGQRDVPGRAARAWPRRRRRAPRWRPNWRWPAARDAALRRVLRSACSTSWRAAAAADEFGARRLAERIVLAVQAGLLLRHAPAVCRRRLRRLAPGARRRRRLRPPAGRGRLRGDPGARALANDATI